MQAIERWRKNRQRQKGSYKLMRFLPNEAARQAFSVLVKTPNDKIERFFGGYFGKVILGIVRLYAGPISRGLKEISVRITSAKRPWSSRISILVRLKW